MSRRILLLTTDLEIGGTPTVVRELAVRLATSTSHIEVACLGKWGPVADQLHAGGVEVTALHASSARDFSAIAKLITLIRARKFDTVLSFLVHANAAAASASIMSRGVRFLQSIQTTQRNPKWHWKVQRIAQHACEKVIVPSESVARAAREWADVPQHKLVVIPNAIDADEFARSPFPNLDPRPYPLGFIGRLDPIKRIPHLLSAIALLEKSDLAGQVHLHIFGDGSERQSIEHEIARLNLSDRVTLYGAIARPQKALARIGCLILPSEAEGFGLVLIEAMAAGVPVIASNVPGIRDVIRPNETGLLIDPHSPQDLAHAITNIVRDRPLRNRLIESGLTDVHRFSWESILPMYQNVLDLKVINGEAITPVAVHRR